MNVAFSGKLDGGFVPGLTVLAGESKTFKSHLSLMLAAAYQRKYADAIVLLYDVEKGMHDGAFEMSGVDRDRVLHITDIEHIEQLKFDIAKRLSEIKKGEHVFILIDSLGAIGSKKEIDDANEEKAVADMTRAKAIRSLYRVMMPHLTIKNLPCVAISHIYMTQEMYAKPVINGGTSHVYMANQIFIITRKQDKDGKVLNGFEFTLNVEKSRFIKEKSKLSFNVSFEDALDKQSGMMEEALDMGLLDRKGAWTTYIPTQEKFQSRLPEHIFEAIVNDEEFKQYVYKKYAL
jgi:hypothetical protein